MKELILIGGGGHCKACIDVIELEGRFKIIGIIDQKQNLGEKVLDYEIIGTDEDIPALIKTYPFFLLTVGQLGSSEIRKKILCSFKENPEKFPTIVSPLAYVSKHSKLGSGSIVMHFAMVNSGASVGEHCIINTKSLIEHDVVIEDFCHIATGAIVNGGAIVRRDSFVGSGSVVKQAVVIPERSFIKANSLFR